MNKITPDMTMLEVLNINPRAAGIFFKYGIRTLFTPEISNQTLQHLCFTNNINISNLLEELNSLNTTGTLFKDRNHF